MMNNPSLLPRITIILIVVFLSCTVVWASYAELDEIARGAGKVIPAGKTQTVQATQPGVVKLINVQSGQVVKKGDLIARLDDTTTASSLGESTARRLGLMAKIARLEMEQAGKFDGFECPAEVQEQSPDVCLNEVQMLLAQKQKFENALNVLIQRKNQREQELGETKANIERLTGNVSIAKKELDLLGPMAKKRLVAKTELIRAQGQLSENKGQLIVAKETIKRIKGSIEEADLHIKELALQLKQERLSEKSAALAELAVLNETLKGDKDRVSRTDIRSPVDGIINTLAVNTVGSFVQPGALIAEVVPTADELMVEAKISPNDIAFIRAGQPALVRVTAYDFSIYGGLEATVATVAADSIVEKETGAAYFQVLVKTDKSYLENHNKRFEITPGMIASVDIITGRKTLLHYLLKPINKARQEALTER